MKILIIIFLLGVSIPVEANLFTGISKVAGSIVGGVGSIFSGGSKTEVEIGTKKSTELEDINTGVNNNKTAIDALSKNQITMKDVESLITAKIVGYDKSQKAGRDIISVKKNDAKLMAYIVGAILTTMSGIIGGLITLITLLIRSGFKRERELIKQIFEREKDRDVTEAKLKAVEAHRDNLFKSKNFYKDIARNGSK